MNLKIIFLKSCVVIQPCAICVVSFFEQAFADFIRSVTGVDHYGEMFLLSSGAGFDGHGSSLNVC